jgi:acetyl-CoA carboxylase carboxyl transferase subunit alpha
MARIQVPVIVVIIGEGGSGGALALGVGNRVYILENAIYSVISPESCAAIIYRDAAHASRAAEALKLTANELLGLGLVDGVIPEPGGAHEDPESASVAVAAALNHALDELSPMSPRELVDQRYEKFRRMGGFFAE